jgi:uncharacterized protein (DUF2164 family)
MNERIRELAEQAGITTNIDTDYFEKDMNKWVDYYSQKFAELVVGECKENFGKVWYEQGLDIRGAELGKFMRRVEQHFGVK